jgi:hypothetical protein
VRETHAGIYNVHTAEVVRGEGARKREKKERKRRKK